MTGGYNNKFVRSRTVASNDGKELYIGYDALFLFMIVLLNAFLSFQYFQSTEISQDLLFIGIFQVLMGVGGLTAGLAINRGIVSIKFPTRDRINETYIYGAFIASVVFIADFMIASSYPQTSFIDAFFDMNLVIPLAAGVVEESFFSLTVAMVLYRISLRMFRNWGLTADMMAIIFASMFTAAFFAMIHLYVYRNSMAALFMMFFNRLIYCSVFLKTKNFSMVVFMHLYHNFMILVFG